MPGSVAERSVGRAVSRGLPDFPWDLLEPAKAAARVYPDGIVDLSIGTPVDPVPPSVQAALAAASNSPGYPLTAGSPRLRAAIASWLRCSCGATEPIGATDSTAPESTGLAGPTGGPSQTGVAAGEGFGVLPTIGSKELIAWLPTLLGIGPGDIVVIPSVCYPTYEVGARLAGASVVRSDTLERLGPGARVRLVWVNSPSNPTGRVLPPEQLSRMVDWVRTRGAVLASDECYLPLGWTGQPPVSVLSPQVAGSSYRSLLAVHSLSKRTNLAGYRAGFVSGDPALVAELLAVRKHAGMMVPAPVQAAMIAALQDESHVAQQRERYARRREVLRDALVAAGLRIEHSEAGLYLWATRDEDCWSTVDWLAARGILVAPGSFYGPGGSQHVRVALTATDEAVAAAAERLAR